MKPKPKPKKKPVDATLRNVRSANKRIKALEEFILCLIKTTERELVSLSERITKLETPRKKEVRDERT